MKKKVLIALVSIALLLFVALKFHDAYFTNKLEGLEITGVDMSKLPDGTYAGGYSIFPISVKLEVLVKAGRIVDISLIKHVNGQGADAEVIPDKVIQAQSLEVDTISGATGSSKAILKAIENALSGVAD